MRRKNKHTRTLKLRTELLPDGMFATLSSAHRRSIARFTHSALTIFTVVLLWHGVVMYFQSVIMGGTRPFRPKRDGPTTYLKGIGGGKINDLCVDMILVLWWHCVNIEKTLSI